MAKIERIFTINGLAFAVIVKKGGKLESFVICSDYEINMETHEAEILITIEGEEIREENNIKKLITINPFKSHNVLIEREKIAYNKLKIIFK